MGRIARRTAAAVLGAAADFVRWGLTEGQQYEAALDYAPLPESMRQQLLQRIESLNRGT